MFLEASGGRRAPLADEAFVRARRQARVLAEGGEKPGALALGVSFSAALSRVEEGKPRVTAHHSLGGPCGRLLFLISLGLFT